MVIGIQFIFNGLSSSTTYCIRTCYLPMRPDSERNYTPQLVLMQWGVGACRKCANLVWLRHLRSIGNAQSLGGETSHVFLMFISIPSAQVIGTAPLWFLLILLGRLLGGVWYVLCLWPYHLSLVMNIAGLGCGSYLSSCTVSTSTIAPGDRLVK